MNAYLQISLTEDYCTSIFRIIKREEIRKGTWNWSEDISFYAWVLAVAGKKAADLIPKQIPDLLPQDAGIYSDLEPIKIERKDI